MLNIRLTSEPENVFETLSITGHKGNADLHNEWDELIQKNIITQQDYQWIINPSFSDEVKQQLGKFLKEKDITPEHTVTLLEDHIKKQPTQLNLLIGAMGRMMDLGQTKSIMFSDYDWDNELGILCQQLVEDRIMFRLSSSSKKHYYHYRTFYPRIQPFDSDEILRELTIKHLNIEGLANEHWKFLSLLFFSPDLSLDFEIIKINTGFTEPELREIVTNLKERGLIDETYPRILLHKGLREPLCQYYKANVYQKTKPDIVNQLKQRISRALSNLFIFMNVKQIYERPIGETKTEPFLCKFVGKAELVEYESQFADMICES